jgi:hypothetical protein
MRKVCVGVMMSGVVAIAALPATAQERIVRYTCEQGPSFQVTFNQNKNNPLRDYAKVKLPNRPEPLKLRPLDSRDSIKYGSNLSLLTIFDNQASLEINWLTVSAGCVATK